MRSDIDQLMAVRDLQAVLVTGGEYANVPRGYLSHGVDIHGGVVFKRRGAPAVLIVGGMEMEEAAKSGLAVRNVSDLGYADMIKRAEGDGAKACVELYGKILETFEIAPGKVGIYGVGELNVWLNRTAMLSAAYPQYQFVGETGMTLFDEAYLTKDSGEIKVIKEVAAKTNATLQEAWDYIGSHRASGNSVVKEDGSPLTIGDVKRFVRRDLMDRELEDTSMIFAQGRDCTFPHSRGTDSAGLQLGQPIIFDLFPRQFGGGYFHDCTRTWCVGYAPEAVRSIYEQVKEAFETAVAAYKAPGQLCHTLQDAVLDYFEGKGHPTQRSHPGTTAGYVHGLGHGMGMNIHERPSLSHLVKTDTLQIGNVLTIEPGLYYQDKAIGARIEDTFIIDERGALVSITPFRKDLVVPLRT